MPKVFSWAKKLTGRSPAKNGGQTAVSEGESDSSAGQSPEKKIVTSENNQGNLKNSNGKSSPEKNYSTDRTPSPEKNHSADRTPSPEKPLSGIRRFNPEKRHHSDRRPSPEKRQSSDKKYSPEKRHNSDRRPSPEKRLSPEKKTSSLAKRLASFRILSLDRKSPEKASRSKSKSPEPNTIIDKESPEKIVKDDESRNSQMDSSCRDSTVTSKTEGVCTEVANHRESQKPTSKDYPDDSVKESRLDKDSLESCSTLDNTLDTIPDGCATTEKSSLPRMSRGPVRQSISEKLYGEVIKEFDKIRNTRPKDAGNIGDGSSNEKPVNSKTPEVHSNQKSCSSQRENSDGGAKQCLNNNLINSRFKVSMVSEMDIKKELARDSAKKDVRTLEKNENCNNIERSLPEQQHIPYSQTSGKDAAELKEDTKHLHGSGKSAPAPLVTPDINKSEVSRDPCQDKTPSPQPVILVQQSSVILQQDSLTAVHESNDSNIDVLEKKANPIANVASPTVIDSQPAVERNDKSEAEFVELHSVTKSSSQSVVNGSPAYVDKSVVSEVNTLSTENNESLPIDQDSSKNTNQPVSPSRESPPKVISEVIDSPRVDPATRSIMKFPHLIMAPLASDEDAQTSSDESPPALRRDKVIPIENEEVPSTPETKDHSFNNPCRPLEETQAADLPTSASNSERDDAILNELIKTKESSETEGSKTGEVSVPVICTPKLAEETLKLTDSETEEVPVLFPPSPDKASLSNLDALDPCDLPDLENPKDLKTSPPEITIEEDNITHDNIVDEEILTHLIPRINGVHIPSDSHTEGTINVGDKESLPSSPELTSEEKVTDNEVKIKEEILALLDKSFDDGKRSHIAENGSLDKLSTNDDLEESKEERNGVQESKDETNGVPEESEKDITISSPSLPDSLNSSFDLKTADEKPIPPIAPRRLSRGSAGGSVKDISPQPSVTQTCIESNTQTRETTPQPSPTKLDDHAKRADENGLWNESNDEHSSREGGSSLPTSPLVPHSNEKPHPVPAARSFHTISAITSGSSNGTSTGSPVGRKIGNSTSNVPPRPPMPTIFQNLPSLHENSLTVPHKTPESSHRDVPTTPRTPSDSQKTPVPRARTKVSLNPFDSDDDEEASAESSSMAVQSPSQKPVTSSLNPFDSEDDEEEESTDTLSNDVKRPPPPPSYNPFDEDDDEEEEKEENSLQNVVDTKVASYIPSGRYPTSPGRLNDSISSISSQSSKITLEAESTNPFDDDDDDDEEEHSDFVSPSLRRDSAERQSLAVRGSSPFQREGMRASLPSSARLPGKKKRQAPLPPGHKSPCANNITTTPLPPRHQTALWRGESSTSLNQSPLRKDSFTSGSTLSLTSPKRTPPPRPPPPKSKSISMAHIK